MLSRLPLRLRVALAFLLAAAVALVALGVFVQLRVADALEDRTHDLLEAEVEGLADAPPDQRAARVAAMGGDVHAQLYDADGAVLASSPLVADRLPTADGDHDVAVLDDDELADGEREAETEPVVVRTLRADGQTIVVATSREDVDEALAEVRLQLLVGGPVALLVAGVLGYVVAGLGLRPIERIRRQAATISDRSAGERLPVPVADDELRRLALTLNAMLDRLDEGLQRQRRFVAEASHELRTPLALLRTEVDLALARPRPAEELADALRSVLDETVRLTALAEDLLLLAAADEGRLVVARDPVDLRAVAEDVAARFGAAPYSVTVAGGATAVPGDRDRLERVVANLVDNAIRHGRPPVTIDVAGSTVTVTDHGDGFAVDDPFGRFVGSQVSSGLGLAIVREIVTAHGGTIRVDRRDGTTSVRVDLDPPG